MPVILRYVTACFLSLVVLYAQAKPLEGLYRVEEPLLNQQPTERDEALRRAFDTLILRLTGNAEAAQNPVLATVRANPQQWVTRFGYEQSRLVVDFDPTSVQRGLRQAGLNQWGAERPSLLVWWLNDAPEASQLVGDGQPTATLLRSAAQYRGLPLLLPLGDLSEQLAVNASVLQTGDQQALQPVSSRYAADGLLSVYAQNANGSWQASWKLGLGTTQTQGQVAANSLPDLADAVMRAVQVFLAPSFLTKPTVTEPVLVEVQGANLARFAELDRLLAANGRLVLVEGDRLLYRLEASVEQLQARLQQAQLQAISNNEQAPAPLATGRTPLLRYRW